MPIYRNLLSRHPDDPDLHHLLALALQGPDPSLAWTEMHCALALAPHVGLYLHNAARLAATRPNDPSLLTRLLVRALALDPASAEAQHRVGALAARAGERRAALARFRRSLILDPGFPPALLDHANLAADAGEDALAVCRYRRLLAGGAHADGLGALGNLFFRTGRLAEAIDVLVQLARFAPERVDAHGALGVALAAAGDMAGAIIALRRSLALDPGSSEAWQALAGVHADIPAESEAAIAAASRASRIAPTRPEPHLARSVVLFHQGRVGEALAARRAALALTPGDAQAHYEFLPFLHLDPDLGPAEQLAVRQRIHRRFSDPLTRQAAPHPNDPDPDRRLKIGYVDNRMLYRSTHSTNLLPTIEAHDPQAAAVHFYTNLPAAMADDMTDRYRAVAAGFRHTNGLSDEDVVRLVRADGIDILVDVSGHLTGARTGVFARKPAPIQVTMLQVGSNGLQAMDYAVADPVLLPPSRPTFFSETIIRLPMGFLFEPVADLTPPQTAAMPSRAPTFGSLNLLAKINGRVLALWGRMLARVPDSRLLLKAAGLSCPATRRRIEGIFAARGIVPERLDLRAWTSGYAAHLATFEEVDVVLDSFPYPGMTTSLEALLMGVPVVTLAGDRFAARIGESILAAVGHPEWIARDEDEYVAIAAGLVQDRETRAALRRHLRGELLASPLCDARSFTRALEAAFREAWRRWCAGRGA
ncbi:MAG: tetratricopeptide repeat protein [Proteobacteria bacterium]|nr:tetratricopeptide repeat protein [Pseudomonadota bacterium]